MLIQPRVGTSSTLWGRIWPKATTATTSGSKAFNWSTASWDLKFSGWYTGMPFSRASSFTGEAVSFMPRFLGRSGWV